MARQISIDATNAINTLQPLRKGNTEVRIEEGKRKLYLHGNHIATVYSDNGDRLVTLYTRGWETVTTKERLNAVLFYCNTGFGQFRLKTRNHELMLEKYTVLKGVSDETYTIPFKEGVTINFTQGKLA